jgi:hypothetical protein
MTDEAGEDLLDALFDRQLFCVDFQRLLAYLRKRGR